MTPADPILTGAQFGPWWWLAGCVMVGVGWYFRTVYRPDSEARRHAALQQAQAFATLATSSEAQSRVMDGLRQTIADLADNQKAMANCLVNLTEAVRKISSGRGGASRVSEAIGAASQALSGLEVIDHRQDGRVAAEAG